MKPLSPDSLVSARIDEISRSHGLERKNRTPVIRIVRFSFYLRWRLLE